MNYTHYKVGEHHGTTFLVKHCKLLLMNKVINYYKYYSTNYTNEFLHKLTPSDRPHYSIHSNEACNKSENQFDNLSIDGDIVLHTLL